MHEDGLVRENQHKLLATEPILKPKGLKVCVVLTPFYDVVFTSLESLIVRASDIQLKGQEMPEHVSDWSI